MLNLNLDLPSAQLHSLVIDEGECSTPAGDPGAHPFGQEYFLPSLKRCVFVCVRCGHTSLPDQPVCDCREVNCSKLKS